MTIQPITIEHRFVYAIEYITAIGIEQEVTIIVADHRCALQVVQLTVGKNSGGIIIERKAGKIAEIPVIALLAFQYGAI